MTFNSKAIAVSATLLGAVASTVIVSSAMAQTPANPDPNVVHPGAYSLEPQHTQVMFRVYHLGFSTYYGSFSGASGSLRLDPHDPAADALQVTIPIASVHTTSPKLDDELKSADWFGATAYPTASFQSTGVVPTGPGKADVTGSLTLHGVTKPMVLHVHFNGAGVNPLDKAYTAGFEGSGHIKRSDFGVSKYVPLVGDEVELIISGAFEHQPM